MLSFVVLVEYSVSGIAGEGGGVGAFDGSLSEQRIGALSNFVTP